MIKKINCLKLKDCVDDNYWILNERKRESTFKRIMTNDFYGTMYDTFEQLIAWIKIRTFFNIPNYVTFVT